MSRYFVSNARDAAGAPTLGTYWRAAQGFGGLVGSGDSYARLNAGEPVTRGADRYHTNLNLLAHALGDVPRSRSLVPSSPYEVRAGTVLDLQPFAASRPATPAQPRELPIGAQLAGFLDDPLGNGSALELCLPWFDEDVVLGPSGGWLRDSEDLTRTFHGGIDASTRPRRLFDVAATQEGEVIAVIHGGAETKAS